MLPGCGCQLSVGLGHKSRKYHAAQLQHVSVDCIASAFCLFEDFNVGNKFIPVDVENGAEAALVELLNACNLWWVIFVLFLRRCSSLMRYLLWNTFLWFGLERKASSNLYVIVHQILFRCASLSHALKCSLWGANARIKEASRDCLHSFCFKMLVMMTNDNKCCSTCTMIPLHRMLHMYYGLINSWVHLLCPGKLGQ